MPIKKVRLNTGFIIHALDTKQRAGKPEAICGRQPGGGKTHMGKKRSRWVLAPDQAVTCQECLDRLGDRSAT